MTTGSLDPLAAWPAEVHAREELRCLVSSILTREMRGLTDRVQRDVREEFRRWILQEQQPPTGFLGTAGGFPGTTGGTSTPPPVKVPTGVTAGGFATGVNRLSQASNKPLQPSLRELGADVSNVNDSDTFRPSRPSTPFAGGENDDLPGMVPDAAHQNYFSVSDRNSGKSLCSEAYESDNMFGENIVIQSRNGGQRPDYKTRMTQKFSPAPPAKDNDTAVEEQKRAVRMSIISPTGQIQKELKRKKSKKMPLAKFLESKQEEDINFYDVCQWLVTSDLFDYMMGAILLANAATIGIQTNYFAETHDQDIPISFRCIDFIFCTIFFAEMSLRLYVYRMDFFKGVDWKWNAFDSLIVFFQIFDEVVKLLFWNTPVQDAMDSVGVIRMLRLARLLRLVRMVRLIPELKSMVYLIFASIGSFVWSLMLIVIMIYCFAIYFTEIGTDMIADEVVTGESVEELSQMWGDVPSSVLSLSMAITGGDDWRSFTDCLKPDKAYLMHVSFFLIYISFATLVMLNLVTGVFVEGAQRIIREDKDTELLNMASRIFDLADEDNSLTISWEEFNNQLKTGHMDDFISAIGISFQEAEHLYEMLDTDDSGTVSIAEFVKGCLRLRSPAKTMDLAEVEYKLFSKISQVMEQIAALEKQVQSKATSEDLTVEQTKQIQAIMLTSAATMSEQTPNFGMEEVLV